MFAPPNETIEQHNFFLSEMEAILARLSSHKSDNIIISADLNFGNTYCLELPLPTKPLDNTAPDLFSSYGYNQLIDIPTRISDCISLIDLFFTNNITNLVCNGTISPIADHEGVFASFVGTKTKLKTNQKRVFYYSKVKINDLIEYLNKIDYESRVFSLPTINQADAYSDILTDAFLKFVPSKLITIRENDQPWLNSFTRLLIRKKNRNYALLRRATVKLNTASNSPNVSPEFITKLTNKKTNFYNKYRESLKTPSTANKRAKTNFFSTVNSTLKNHEISAKKKFSILTKLMNNCKNSNISTIIEDGSHITDPADKAELFNNFFANKATVDNSDDEVPHLEPKNVNITLTEFNTSPIELAHIMRNIKKSNNSYCGVPGKFLSLIATPVSFVYYKILNGLFEIGYFPDIFKLGHICCIYKGATAGPMTSKNSWRPITLLPTLSKVAESVVHKRLLSHLIDNDLISHRQAAYLKGDSTIQQLSIIIHKIKMAWSKGEKK